MNDTEYLDQVKIEPTVTGKETEGYNRELVRSTSRLERIKLATPRRPNRWTQKRREAHTAWMKALWTRRKALEN